MFWQGQVSKVKWVSLQQNLSKSQILGHVMEATHCSLSERGVSSAALMKRGACNEEDFGGWRGTEMGANVDHHLLEEKNLGTLGKEEGWGKWWGLSGFCRSGMRRTWGSGSGVCGQGAARDEGQDKLGR